MGSTSSAAASGHVRLFFAMPLPAEALGTLAEAVERVRRRAQRSRLHPRFLQREQLHLTLKFLGWVDPDRVPALEETTAREAAAHAPIEVRFAPVTAFPSPRRARVVVAQLQDRASQLSALASSIEDAVEAFGIPREQRAFRPHVTVARIKRPGNAEDLVEASQLSDLAFRLDELRLYQSILKPSGAEYVALRSEALTGSEPPRADT